VGKRGIEQRLSLLFAAEGRRKRKIQAGKLEKEKKTAGARRQCL